MILVDTSAWVEFFRGTSPWGQRVDELLEQNQVALCGPIVTELRRGLRPAERKKVLPLLDGCRWLEQPGSLWEEAGELGMLAQSRGTTVKSMDLLIATYALAHGVSILTSDSDFLLLERLDVGLVLAPPAPRARTHRRDRRS
ncbi:MAG: PIN domain-containing protein [Myxococcaceae bacterium]